MRLEGRFLAVQAVISGDAVIVWYKEIYELKILGFNL